MRSVDFDRFNLLYRRKFILQACAEVLAQAENSLANAMTRLMFSCKMKIYFRWDWRVMLAAGCLCGFSSFGQIPGGAGPGGMSAALTKLFGKNTAFSAKGEMQVTDTTKHEIAFWPMDFALLDRKIRVEIDLTQTRNKGMPAGTAATLKQIGMAQVVSIIRPDKGLVYVIYPDQRVLLSMPLPKEDQDSDKAPQVAKTPLGKEDIDGHPCVKNRVVVTDSSGRKMEATTWDATDLNDLPIQIETQEKDNTSMVRFKKIQFSPPASGSFEPPNGYVQYQDADELKVGVMKKMLENANKK